MVVSPDYAQLAYADASADSRASSGSQSSVAAGFSLRIRIIS
jgi:hypothetical protein